MATAPFTTREYSSASALTEQEAPFCPKTDTFTPIPANVAARMMEDALSSAGVGIRSQKWKVSDRENKFGFYSRTEGNIVLEQNGVLGRDFSINMIMANGHDQSLVGWLKSTQLVCSNGMVATGTDDFLRVIHRGDAVRRYSERLDAFVGTVKRDMVRADIRDDLAKRAMIDRRDENHLLGELVRVGAMPGSRFDKVVREHARHRHDEWADLPNSVWKLQQAITEVGKEDSEDLWPVRSVRTKMVLDKFLQPMLDQMYKNRGVWVSTLAAEEN